MDLQTWTLRPCMSWVNQQYGRFGWSYGCVCTYFFSYDIFRIKFWTCIKSCILMLVEWISVLHSFSFFLSGMMTCSSVSRRKQATHVLNVSFTRIHPTTLVLSGFPSLRKIHTNLDLSRWNDYLIFSFHLLWRRSLLILLVEAQQMSTWYLGRVLKSCFFFVFQKVSGYS